MMFSEPARVRAVVEQMRWSDQPRAMNRARIDSLFNGDPPYTDLECTNQGIFTNYNDLSGPSVLQDAYRQASMALLGSKELFNVAVVSGDPAKRNDWGQIITSDINRRVKRTQRYISTVHGQACQNILHGVSPVTFPRDGDWCPTLQQVSNVLVPGRTLTTLENLTQFCVIVDLTAGELLKYISGSEVDPGWNQELIRKIVSKLAQNCQEGTTDNSAVNLWMEPEKVEQDFKANAGYWSSDVVQTVRCYDFYFQENYKDKSGKWKTKINRRILADTSVLDDEEGDQWLYNPKDRSYGDEWSQCLHVQFADGSVVAPFMWHTVRSLGFMLYAVCHFQNRLRCRFTDAVNESMMWYFRNVSTGDEERLQRIVLNNMGIIPEGVSFVPGNERHTIDPQLLAAAFAMNKETISQHATAFRGGTGTTESLGEPISATQASLEAHSSQAMLNGMLTRSYGYATFQYREVMRRFLMLDHPDCVAFRTHCLKQGVPQEILNMEALEVTAQQTLGSGNKAIESAQAAFLTTIFDRLPSESQNTALHIITEAGTNADVAEMLVPLKKTGPTEAQEVATLSWGTLVDGQPVVLARGIDKVGYITTLLAMLGNAMAQIEGGSNQSGQPATPPTIERVRGLANVILHIEGMLQPLAADKGKAEFVTAVQKQLSVAANELRGYTQRIQEQQAAGGQGGPDPEVLKDLMTTKSKLEIKAAAAAQQRQQRDANFLAEQQRKDLGVQAQVARDDVKTQAEILRTNSMHNAELDMNEEAAAAEQSTPE